MENAIAPDLFVLPIDAMPVPEGRTTDWPKSYRQDKTGGPAPSVAVEIPSDTDTFASLRTKTSRCRRLGVTVYLVVIDSSPPEVLRLAADGHDDELWIDRPIPELGGLRIGFDDHGTLTVTAPDGLSITSEEDLADQLEARAETAESRVAEAERRAAEAERRAEELAERLRELGGDPLDG